MPDYKTLRGTSTFEYEEKRSRFIATAAFADTEEKALAVLNAADEARKPSVVFSAIGLKGKYSLRDVWQHKDVKKNASAWSGTVAPHETKVFVLNPLPKR